jgi:transcription initiation factor TFIID TATA-box-binding protein
MPIETIKGGCPICASDVKGDDEHLFFCKNCSILYKREHLAMSVEALRHVVKDKFVKTLVSKKRELPEPLHIRPIKDRAPKTRELPPKNKPVSIPLRIVNMFVTTNYGIPLPLEKIVEKLTYATYDTKKASGALVKTKNPKATVMLHRTGKAICFGVHSTNDAKLVISHVAAELNRIGIRVRETPPVKVLNIACSGSVDRKLPLSKLAFKLKNAEYEPDDFPGLVLRLSNPKVTFILFENGKLVSAGLTKEDEVPASYHALMDALDAAL